MPAQVIRFGDFRLDTVAQELRCGDELRPLRPKSFAVLRYLASHPGRIVPHDEITRAVWLDTNVSSTVLRVCTREIRAALGETGERHVITAPRRGLRFVLDPDHETAARPFVGREAELARLHMALVRAERGARQLVFVLGCAGTGKSRLVEHFLDEVRSTGRARIATGQCLEFHGGLEAYAPMLDLLSRLGSEAAGDAVGPVMAQLAPSWLAQLRGVSGDAPLTEPAGDTPRQTAGRMLRELTALFEALATSRLLVLVLADVHWSDASTVDALAHLAQRGSPARLLVVCTHRPLDPGPSTEPLQHLKRELEGRGRSEEIRLHALDDRDIAIYLEERLAPHRVGDGVAHVIHAETGGLPLFLVAMVDHLLATRALAAIDGTWRIVKNLDGVIPDAVEQIVATGLQRVPPDRRHILDVASVAGASFPAAAIAPALQMSIDAIEDACEELVADGRLLRAGIETWPDGMMSGRFQFTHALQAEVLYKRLPDAARARLHLAVGEAIAAGHGDNVTTVAAILARHFTLGGDIERGSSFHRKAARSAIKRFAANEAVAHLEAALSLLRALPDSEQRTVAELRCTLDLCENLATAGGFAADAVRVVHERARDLGTRLALVPAQIVGCAGLFAHHSLRGELLVAHGLAEQLAALAVEEPALSTMAHGSLGSILFTLGHLSSARTHLERAVADPAAATQRLTLDSLTTYRCFLAMTLLLEGDLVRATETIESMLGDAALLHSDPYRLAHAHNLAAHFHATAGDRLAAGRHADRAIALAGEHGFVLNAAAAVVSGWARCDAGAIREGIAADARMGIRLSRPLYAALLAETLLEQGESAAAARTIDEAIALVEETGEVHHLAELHRLRGECLLHATEPPLASGDGAARVVAALESFATASATAHDQGARLFELRAAISACAVPRRPRSLVAQLRKIHDGFAGGVQSSELSAARAILRA